MSSFPASVAHGPGGRGVLLFPVCCFTTPATRFLSVSGFVWSLHLLVLFWFHCACSPAACHLLHGKCCLVLLADLYSHLLLSGVLHSHFHHEVGYKLQLMGKFTVLDAHHDMNFNVLLMISRKLALLRELIECVNKHPHVLPCMLYMLV